MKEAYKKALEDYQRDHPDAEVGKDLKIDLPKSPPKQPNALPAGYIDPHALMAGGGGGGLGMFGGGWYAGWNVHVPPPIPNHLRVEPYERAVRGAQDALGRAQRALDVAVMSQERAQASERDMQARLWGAEGGAAMETGSRKRRKGVPSGHHTPAGIAALKNQLSAASVNRRAAELRFEAAERELERSQQNLAILRGDLDERRAALEAWRAQQQVQQQAQHQAAVEERRRLMEAEAERHMERQRLANEARARELREMRERMVARERVQQRVGGMVVPRRQPARAPARAPAKNKAKTPPKTRKKR